MIEREGRFKKSGLLLFFSMGLLFLFSGCLPSETNDPASLPAGVINLSKSTTVSFAPAIAAKGEIVYVVWADTSGNQEIFMARSGDGGQSFSLPVNVSTTADPSTNPKISVSGTNVYIVWEEFLTDRKESDIFFRKAEDTDGLLTWSDSQNRSLSAPICGPNQVGTDPCPSQFPTIAADGDMVLVAWNEAANYVLKDITTGNTGKDFSLINGDISLVASSDRGTSFNLLGTSPTILSKPNPSPSSGPALAAANGKFYIAWTDFVPPNLDQADSKIVFRSFDSTTFIFNPPISSFETILSEPINGPAGPALAAGSVNSYVVFEGTPVSPSGCTPSSDIFFAKSADGFATIPTPVNISKSKCRASGGKIAVSGNDIYIVWEDNSPSLNGILFRKSIDGGLTFSDAAKLTHVGNSVAAPAISTSPTNLFSAWEDALPGNLEIFFRKR